MFKKTTQRVDKVDTVIGPGTVFEGTIKATGIVRIDGKLSGNIETSGDIIVGDKGEVNAELSGNSVTIAGKVMGNVFSKEKTTILNKGVIEGDISTKNIIIEDGALFKGSCTMNNDTREATNRETATSKSSIANASNRKDSGKK